MKKVLYILFLMVVIISCINFLVQSLTDLWIPPGIWLLPFIYAGIGVLSYRLLSQGALKSPHRFVLGVNLSVLIKLLGSAIICAVYFALRLPEKITFTIAVALNYVVFTIVMLQILLKSVKNG